MKIKRIVLILITTLLFLLSGIIAQASPGWVSPTGFVDGGGTWADEALTYDENTLTFAYEDIPATGYGNYLELTHAAIDCDKVQIWSDRSAANVDTIEVDVYYSSAWHNIFSGVLVIGAYQEYAIGSTQSVTALRVRYSTNKKNRQARVVEADFDEVSACTPDIDNAPISKDFGLYVESNTYETGLTYYTVTNNSGGAITITIQATDFTGGDGWTLSDTATPGENIAGLKAGLEGSDYTVIVKKTPAYNILVSGLANEATQKWGLRLYTPTSFSDGIEKTTIVTLTATCD